MTSKELVLKYFHSWQQPADFQELASCLSENFVINAGFFQFNNRPDFIQFLEANPTPWKEVILLSSFFEESFAAILYEGVNTATNQKMRVSEHIQLENGKIKEVQTVIAQV